MSQYTIKVITKTAENSIPLTHSSNTAKIQAQENAKYQIFNEQGELIVNPKVEKINEDDLAVYLDNSSEPSFILEDYYSVYPIEDSAYLAVISASLATSSREAPFVLASEVASAGLTSKILYGLGAAALIGGALALSGGNGGSSGSAPAKPAEKPKDDKNIEEDKKTEENKEETPNTTGESINVTLSFNSVTSDNLVNLSESKGEVVVSGQFTADKPFTQAQVWLEIGSERFEAIVTGSTFSAKIPGTLLAQHQQIKASISVENGQSKGNAEGVHIYGVDAEIVHPNITLNTIANDNIVNIAESNQPVLKVGGKVTNVPGSEAKPNDKVIVKIGDQTFVTILKSDLSFEIAASGQLLAKNRKISVELETKDNAGNAITTLAEKAYAVDLLIVNPEIQINAIATDDILNAIELENEVMVSGLVTNVDESAAKKGDVVTLVIGSHLVTTKLDEQLKFSVSVAGEWLKDNDRIDATLTTEDPAGNRKESQASRNYAIDKEIVHPKITFDVVTYDNTINQTEGTSGQNVTVSGKVENVGGSEAKIGDKVILTIGDHQFEAVLTDDLTFSVNVPGNVLVNAERKVKASLLTKDIAGNELVTNAEHSYFIDQVIADPTITIENITPDNIVNIQESGEKIIVRGKVENVVNSAAKANDKVVIKIGEHTFETSLQSDLSFSVEVDGALLAKNNRIEATLTTQDTAENRLTTVKTHGYLVDTDIAAPNLIIDKIATDDIINAVEKQAETILVTGKAVNVAHAEAKEGDVVTLTVGQSQVTGKLDRELKFSIPVSTIALVNHKEIFASLSTQDRALNSITAQASKTVSVDDSFNVSVSVSDIAVDNKVNKQEAAGQITLSGTYTADADVKADSVVITLLINNQERAAEVNTQNNTWQLVVAGGDLALAEGENRIVAKIKAEDTAGNPAESTTTQAYQVDTVLNKPVVRITSIAEDDVIDATEANGKVKIKGIVENAEGDNPVVVLCPCQSCASGWKEVEATVVDGKFEVEVLVSETSLANAKLKSSERKVKANYTAKDDAGNEEAADEASRKYTLEDSYREINITKIGDNFGLDMSGSTRVTGSIQEFGVVSPPADAALYNQGKNARFIRMVKLVIGDKTYQAGFDGLTKSFHLDIPNADWATIAGKSVKVDFTDHFVTQTSFYSKVTSPYFENNVTYLTPGRVPTVKKFTLESDLLVKNGDNSYSIKPLVTEKTEISGIVKGDVAVGANIDVKAGSHTVQTQVKEGKTFSVLIDTIHLKNNASGVITATLKDTGSDVVMDSEVYVQPKAVSATFVSQHSEIPVASRKIDHTKDDYNFFYPIHLLDQGPTKFGFLRNVEIGSSEVPLTVKYHFLRTNEINQLPTNTQGLEAIGANSAEEIPDSLKATFRYAYQQIAKYTNLKFEEVTGGWQEVADNKGTLLFVGDLQATRYKGSSAIGYPGGNLVWDKKILGTAGTDDYSHYMAIHEILHTLNMRHAHDSFTDVKSNPPEATAFNHVAEASSEFSNMSYWTVRLFDAMRDLRMYDLAYLHYRFGVNRTHRAGDDVYTFRKYDARKADGDIYIWDGNGVDTFDASMEKEGVTVNLTPGSWNYRGTERKFNFVTDGRTVYDKNTFFDKPGVNIRGSALNNSQNEISGNPVSNPPASGVLEFNNYHDGQSFIGYGTQIENLIGSKFDDKLTGNKAANNIFGGDGVDTIAGGEGDDFINGGLGDDLMFGNQGNDTYVIDSVADVVTEEADQGTDHIYSLVNYTLDANVENLTLIGTTAKNGTGNALNNEIRGNDAGNILNGLAGNDILIGGLGADTLSGGEGQDTFVFESSLNGKVDTITDFVVGQDKIKLSATIFSAISADLSNIKEHLFYDTASGELSYNSQNGGADNATPFAIVAGLQNLEGDKFIIG
ncbi:Ig-like domain-containing protein [Mannheimia granulomatis]|uniref:Ig-like domain-containing protein n=1 Tax=Mannheimia granulomatis TaxID=85402 RepID=UPI00047DC806|nr:Ig-like domain-containing protein [Mannheimia granulomatis]QLB18247.1 hypothetical protein A6B41_01600 [Mannheimia granulomatis]